MTTMTMTATSDYYYYYYYYYYLHFPSVDEVWLCGEQLLALSSTIPTWHIGLVPHRHYYYYYYYYYLLNSKTTSQT